MNELLSIAAKAAVEAGKEILKIYKTGDFGVEAKSDNSPLTLADKAGHNIIVEYLQETGLPILSEEGKHADYEERRSWNQLWVVDPLDGTKEFIKKTGEFTVNIALVENNYPVMGVVLIPATGELYYSDSTDGAYKLILASEWFNQEFSLNDHAESQKLPLIQPEEKLQIVASVSHLSPETKVFAQKLEEKYGESDFVSVGSSIKICKVAEGSADVYPRLGPTMEWDTAAGQAIVEGAGMGFLNWKTIERFDYNRPDLLNEWFVVYGKRIETEELKHIIKVF